MSAFEQSGTPTQMWGAEQEAMLRNVLEPIIEYYKSTKDTPEDEVKEQVKKLVALSGVCRPSTPVTAKKEKKKPPPDSEKNLRFLGECCVCGLEKRGNYDRLGFMCAGCRTVPLRAVQAVNSTRVPRVRYSEHYVPSLVYPKQFNFLPDILATQSAKAMMMPSMMTTSPALFASNDPCRYSVFRMDIQREHSQYMLSAVESLRTLYHPSFLYNFAISRDVARNQIWVVHETAYPIELRGALLTGQRCFELLRQMAVAALSGLLFLKDFNRTHNDLRPHNFFIDDRHRVKLRLAPYPAEDLPAPFSYENSFFSVGTTPPAQSSRGGESAPGYLNSASVSGSSFAIAVTDADGTGTGADLNADQDAGSTQSGHLSKSTSATSLRAGLATGGSTSFATKIDSYCLSRRTSRRRASEQGSRDMFVLGVTLTLIAYGDVDNLPLPTDEDAGSDPDELFLVEFIWRLLTGERTPDEALRDDYLTTVRLVDGAAVETIVLRVVSSTDVPEAMLQQLDMQSSPPQSPSPTKGRVKFEENAAPAPGPGARVGGSAANNPEFQEVLNAASMRFRVNHWNSATAKLVSFFNDREVPSSESEAVAADPHLFQVVRTPTQLTFYSVRRDPRLLRARQITSERHVNSFDNALVASTSMTLAKAGASNGSSTFSM